MDADDAPLVLSRPPLNLDRESQTPVAHSPAYRSTTILTRATRISAAMSTMTVQKSVNMSPARDTVSKARRLTNPLKLLPVTVAELVFEHSQ